MNQLVTSVLAWACTGGMVLVVSWAFSVGADLRAVSGVPARLAALEARVNAREIDAARREETMIYMRQRMDQLQKDLEALRGGR